MIEKAGSQKKAFRSRSNPTAPTIVSLGTSKANASHPPSIPPIEATGEVQFRQLLAAIGQAILNAAGVSAGQAPVGFAPTGLTLNQAVKEFLHAKARAGASDVHLKRLGIALKSFASGHGRGRAPVAAVTAAQLEKWLHEGEWAPKTARNYLTDTSIFFNYCLNRGYIERNPARGVLQPKTKTMTSIEIHTPDQVRTILDTARKACLDVCRHLAVRYFAGLRTSEAHLLREIHLKLDQGLIEVPAANAKTRRRRLITIQPNLRAWLDLGGELRPLGVMTVRKVVRLSKVAWPSNVTRHSFVSYHLAHFKSAAGTALEAGHTEQMLFAHYRALVTPDAAKEFWAITPK